MKQHETKQTTILFGPKQRLAQYLSTVRDHKLRKSMMDWATATHRHRAALPPNPALNTIYTEIKVED